jgi:hypothetical protein
MTNRPEESELNVVIDGRVYRPCSIEDRIAYVAFLTSAPENGEKVIRLQEDEEDGTFRVITDEAWETLLRFGGEEFAEQQGPVLDGVSDQAAFQAKTEIASPPALGELMIVLLCPKNRAQAVLGDLAEQFGRDVAQKGVNRAHLLYLARALRSCPLLIAKIRHTGFWLFVIELGRRFIGA